MIHSLSRVVAPLFVVFMSFFSTNAFSFIYVDTGPAQPYSVTGKNQVVSEGLGLTCTVYRPSNLSGNHPLIVWGNGTNASPLSYAALLNHWASWGFVVVAANTSYAGSGNEMIGCVNAAFNRYGNYLNGRVGASGHSQGGGGAIMAGSKDSRIVATAPMQPYTLGGLGHDGKANSSQYGPMLLLSGSLDQLAKPSENQQNVFNAANVPVFWATRIGANHFETAFDGRSFRGISTAWFLMLLGEDYSLLNLFAGPGCKMCNASGWQMRLKGL